MKVGFIGTGNIGTPMALQLINKGFNLIVNDINFSAAEVLIKKGAEWANSPKELSEDVSSVKFKLKIVSHKLLPFKSSIA